jgi:hypothetical protein
MINSDKRVFEVFAPQSNSAATGMKFQEKNQTTASTRMK